MAAYLIGVAGSQLIYGPLSDGIGRKKPLLTGLIVMFLGTLICFVASDIHTLIAGRFIQGCGAGACACLWRAIFRDVFTGEELSKYGAYLVTFIMFIVPAAPLLGGYLQHYLGWRANFGFMAIYSLIALLVLIFGFKETSRQHHLKKIQPHFILKNYTLLLRNRTFMGITAATFLSYGAIFAWLTTGPILLIQHKHISPVAFGWINFFAAGIAYATAGRLNAQFVMRFGMRFMLRVGWIIMLTAALLMMLCLVWPSKDVRIIVAAIILFYFGSTFIWPNAFALAFTPFGEIAGFAGALYGFMQICGAAVLAALMSYLPTNTPLPLAVTVFIATFFAWLMYEMIVPKQQQKPPSLHS